MILVLILLKFFSVVLEFTKMHVTILILYHNIFIEYKLYNTV